MVVLALLNTDGAALMVPPTVEGAPVVVLLDTEGVGTPNTNLKANLTVAGLGALPKAEEMVSNAEGGLGRGMSTFSQA